MVEIEYSPIASVEEDMKSDDTTSYHVSSAKNAEQDGSVAIAAILAGVVVLCLASVVAYIIYRYYRRRSVHAMNFDNPVYKKTTTTEDGYNMQGQRLHSTANGSLRSPGSNGSSGPFRQHPKQYGMMGTEDSLEPLTKGQQCV